MNLTPAQQEEIQKRFQEQMDKELHKFESQGFPGISGIFWPVIALFERLGFTGQWLSALGQLLTFAMTVDKNIRDEILSPKKEG